MIYFHLYFQVFHLLKTKLIRSRHLDPVFDTKRASFISLKTMMGGFKKKGSRTRNDDETAELEVPAKSKTMLLLTVLVVALMLLGGVWWYQNRDDGSEEDRVASVYIHETTLVVSAELATSDEKYAPDIISGRLIENSVQEALNYGNAVSQSRELATGKVRKDESLWPVPMQRKDEVYPIRFRWFAYNQSEFDRLFKKGIDARNDASVDYIIKTVLPTRWEFTDDVEVLKVEAHITVAAQNVFVDGQVIEPEVTIEIDNSDVE